MNFCGLPPERHLASTESPWAFTRKLLVNKPNMPTVWLSHTIEDFHQGAFACTLFAQQRMDFAGLDGKAYLIIGNNTRIDFGNSFTANTIAASSPLPLSKTAPLLSRRCNRLDSGS